MPRRYCVIYALVATTANIAYIQTIERPRKMSLSMKDIVSLFTRKHDSITVSFVVADLGKLPPIGFNNMDVCTLLV